MRRTDAVRKILDQLNEEAMAEGDEQVSRSDVDMSLDGESSAVISGFHVRPGYYHYYGASEVKGGVNFTVFSSHATSCELLLYKPKAQTPYAIIRVPEAYRMGDVYAIIVEGLDIEQFEYAYRFDGPYDPVKGLIFDPKKPVLDPYAKAVAGQRAWGIAKRESSYHARVVRNSFQWKSSVMPCTPMEDSIIYEMHVRGFTRSKSSGVQYPGTFAAIIERIPYLKSLGITAVELMPIFEFDEVINSRKIGGKQLLEYWGYNTVAFFAPNTAYAASLEYNEEGTELKKMISLLKQNGIETILDVVFNHTAEGDQNGRAISFKGVDNSVYYTMTDKGEYFNYSGCGNTFNCNNPVVVDFIITCLRYWVTEYHIDGFRFDLASILTRGEDGAPMEEPPLMQRLYEDPVLRNTKLIAEPWDAGGLYQVGHFPGKGRWSEWNGRYRDALRDFLKGNYWNAPETAARIMGSPDLYGYGDGNGAYPGARASVNFIDCHDGFTLYDLFTYNNKHNEANGWNNTDGTNDNRSWNCGVEGPSDDPVIKALRMKMMRNAITVLMCSRGTPLILAGDEFGNTQYGNNNSYCQDSEISWLNWDYLRINHDYFDFYRAVIHFRREHPVISRDLEPAVCGLPLISACGANPDDHTITSNNRVLGVLFAGRQKGADHDDVVYMVINAYWEAVDIRLPALSGGLSWGLNIDTDAQDGVYFRKKSLFMSSPIYQLQERSVAVFTLFGQDGQDGKS